MVELNTSPLSDSRILVVDDDLSTRLMLVKILQKEGYEVLQAPHGAAAVELLQPDRMPDLVLLDVVMPEMDGFAVCKHIRQQKLSMPIIMLTGLDDVGAIDQAFGCGATDFITKPINWPLLIRRVRYSLRTYRMTCALDQVRVMQKEAQEVAQLGFFEWHPSTGRLDWSAGVLKLFSLPTDIVAQGVNGYLERVNLSDREQVHQQLERVAAGHLDKATYAHGFSAGDNERHVRAIARRTASDSILCVLQDVTDFYQARQTVDFQRRHDNLTQLYNRTSFYSRVDDALAGESPCAVLSIDIDRFHMINETFGQGEGDKVLQLFSLRLQAATQGFYPLARLSGDEFALLIADLDDVDGMLAWVEQLQLRLGEAYDIADQPVFIETSIGIALGPEHSDKASHLISAAVQARLVAKRAGGSRYKIFDESCQQDYARQLYIESELRHVLERRQLRLFYQPQLDLKSGTVVGVEALIRWQHPEMGLVSPGEFIPIAEQMELIHGIGYWVAEEGIRQAKAWHDQGMPLRVGINLSARQFSDEMLADKLSRMLKDSALPPALLDVEITESVAMDNPEQALFMLRRLQELGVTLALDDFGTGYSSLEYLQKFSVDYIKIDRAFVSNLISNPADQGIVRAVLGIAESLGSRVIAEGVETEEELQLLSTLGCDEIQGYLIGRPMPASDIPAAIAQYSNNESRQIMHETSL